VSLQQGQLWQAKLMAVVDAIKRIFGRGTLVFAVQGFAHSWRMRQEWLSPRYMSRWDELLTV
jgi:DNA polymerase V